LVKRYRKRTNPETAGVGRQEDAKGIEKKEEKWGTVVETAAKKNQNKKTNKNPKTKKTPKKNPQKKKNNKNPTPTPQPPKRHNG